MAGAVAGGGRDCVSPAAVLTFRGRPRRARTGNRRRRPSAHQGAQGGHHRDDLRRRRGDPGARHFVNQLSYEQAAKVMRDCALRDAPQGGEIAFVAASPTSPNHMAHIRIMTELTKTDPKYKVFKIVDTQFAGDDDAKSYDVAVSLMQAHPNLKVIISSSAVSAPAAARAIEATGKAGKVFATGFALPNAIKSYLEDGSEKAFVLWNPFELGYVATYATHLILAGKLKVKEGETFTAGKAGTYTVGKDGESSTASR
jgi:rhamnose transport system substrate-binding protein